MSASKAIGATAGDDTLGWAAVALFYSAVHIAHAVLAVADIPERYRHPENHQGTEPHPGTNIILRTRFLVGWEFYQSLFSESVAVRYEGRRVDQEALNHLRDDYAVLRAWARPILESRGVPRKDWP